MDVVVVDGLTVLKTPLAARYCRVTPQYLRRCAFGGHGPQPRFRTGRGAGGGNFYEIAELDRWLAERAAKRGGQAASEA